MSLYSSVKIRLSLMVVSALSTLVNSTPSWATYNANLQGAIVELRTDGSGIIYFKLSNQPATNGSCSATYFEIDPPGTANEYITTEAALDRVYARLAQAYAAGESVNIGYDFQANCASQGFIPVYTVG